MCPAYTGLRLSKTKMREEKKKLWNESGLRDLPAFTNAIISSNIVPSDLGSIQGLLMTTKKSYLQKSKKEEKLGKVNYLWSEVIHWEKRLENLNKQHANVINPNESCIFIDVLSPHWICNFGQFLQIRNKTTRKFGLLIQGVFLTSNILKLNYKFFFVSTEFLSHFLM